MKITSYPCQILLKFEFFQVNYKNKYKNFQNII